MQMRVLTTSILLSLVIACGSDVKRGNAGESCTSANDCGDGLACIALVCVASVAQAATAADAGNPETDSASCSARRDCPEGAMCVSNVCQAVTMGTSTNARRGGRGESCTAANDCEPELSCLTGICRDSGLSLPHLPKACFRVECETKEDCCATFVPNANCETYKANCDSDPIFCNTYRTLCVCSKTCEDELCVSEVPGCMTDHPASLPSLQRIAASPMDQTHYTMASNVCSVPRPVSTHAVRAPSNAAIAGFSAATPLSVIDTFGCRAAQSADRSDGRVSREKNR